MLVQFLLSRLMNFIVGSNVFGRIQELVLEVSKEDSLTGQQKREKVSKGLEDLGKDIANHLLSLAIEAAVTLMKTKKII